MPLDSSKNELVSRLRTRAVIVRQTPENPSRIADLLEEAADQLEELKEEIIQLGWQREFDDDQLRSRGDNYE